MRLTLRQARERAMLTQDELAASAQVSARTIRRIELGASVPNMPTRRVISTALKRHLGIDVLVIDWPTITTKAEAA